MNFDELYQEGKINEFFFKKINKGYWKLLGESLDSYLKDAIRMSALGIESDEEQDLFFRILIAIPDVYEDIVAEKKVDSASDIENITNLVYLNRHQYPIDSIYGLFCSVADAAKSLNIKIKNTSNLDECKIKDKVAYPIAYNYMKFQPEYDINKWVHATRDIYNRMFKNKQSFESAKNEVTENWDKMEKLDYQYWLRLYNEGIYQKYPKLATANFTMDLLKADLPKPVHLQPFLEVNTNQSSDVNDARTKIETQRMKIINRLNAAEKLLCSLEGQMFAGQDQEFMLKLLQDLKRKVQTANKISVKSTLFEDYIYRTGNYLESLGKEKGARFFKKIAQDAVEVPAVDATDMSVDTSPPSEVSDTLEKNLSLPEGGTGEDATSMEATPPMENLSGKAVGVMPSVTPMPTSSPSAVTIPEEPQFAAEQPAGAEVEEDAVKLETQQAMREFFERLDDGVYDPEDDPDEKRASIDYADIIVTAQVIDDDVRVAPAEAPPPEDAPMQHRAKLPQEQETIEVSENDELSANIEEDNTDDIIEAALNNISIEDAIRRLEMLVSIYKKREISRQLSILDIMMDRLGLGSFFPSLGEAMAKSLEANQYISTRIEDVLNKLKGSAESVSATQWVEGSDDHMTPQALAIKKELQEQRAKEEQRKKLRKQREEQKLMGNTPGVGQQASQELAEPAAIETGTPVVTR